MITSHVKPLYKLMVVIMKGKCDQIMKSKCPEGMTTRSYSRAVTASRQMR